MSELLPSKVLSSPEVFARFVGQKLPEGLERFKVADCSVNGEMNLVKNLRDF